MSRKRTTISAELATKGAEAIRAAMDELRRVRNREYMQHWRANPKHRAIEQKRRYHDYFVKKQRSASRLQRHPYTGVRGQPLCGFCGLATPVEIVERLRIVENAEEEYVTVLVPYCGHC